MQMHFLNTKMLEEKCANCTSPFDQKNLRATKLKISREKIPNQEMEIQIIDALAFIYETSRSEFANNLAQIIEDEENDTILPTTTDSLSVALCCVCAPILAEMYNSHRTFNRLSKNDSIISKIKTFLGKQTGQSDSSVIFDGSDDFAVDLFSDLNYDDNQALCSEIGDNIDLRYEYDPLTDFTQLISLPAITVLQEDAAKSEKLVAAEDKEKPQSLQLLLKTPTDGGMIAGRNKYSGGAKFGSSLVLSEGTQVKCLVPKSDRVTRGMSKKQLTKKNKGVKNGGGGRKKPVPAACSKSESNDISAEEEKSTNIDILDKKDPPSNVVNYTFLISTTTEPIITIDLPSEPTNSQDEPLNGDSKIENLDAKPKVELIGKVNLVNSVQTEEQLLLSSENSIPGKDKVEKSKKNLTRVACGVCGHNICQENMRNHMKIHAPVRETFKCEHCEKVYMHKRNLRVHIKTHKKEEDLNCQFCNKIYPTLLLLKCHEEIHHGEGKPFSCEFCKLTFRRRRELEVHAPVHSTERPFNCEECTSNFKRKKDLRRHEKIHSDSRLDKEAFKCKDCGKILMHSFSLYKHRVKYHRQ